MVQIPRLIEFVLTALNTYLSKFPFFNVYQVDDLVKYLLQYVTSEMNKFYPAKSTVFELYPLLFSTRIDLEDPDIKPASSISHSIFTNNVAKLPVEK
jgi:hypothetical protein